MADPRDLEKMEAQARVIGRMLHRALEGTGWGFTLLLFTMGEKGNLTYLSDTNRADMIRVVEEWLVIVKGGGTS